MIEKVFLVLLGFLALILIVMGIHNFASINERSEIIKNKEVCVRTENSGIKFEKCFELVERR